MVKNCDNCKNQDKSKPIQECNTFGYPLFSNCENWEPKDSKVEEKLRLDELARKEFWR